VITQDELVVNGPRPLRGRLRLPGDKGISHRALLAAALADGLSVIERIASGDDVVRTQRALEALGVEIHRTYQEVRVKGLGIDELREPTGPIDCGNSGTTMRMLTGLLAGRPFRTTLTGDDSLRERPMRRVITPLRAMGAHITGRDDNYAPLIIDGNALHGARVELEVASGQVKSAVVLAGLQASGASEIVEPAPSRDHTERLFAAVGAPVEKPDARATRVAPGAPHAFYGVMPGDPSSAAFFVVATTITPGSHLVLEDVLLNPGRIAFVDVLAEMGARISIVPRGERLGEPVGDLEIEAAPLQGADFTATESIIDEVPVLAVAAAFAEGTTTIRDVTELRVKESNRLATVEQELGQLGVTVEETDGGLVVHGGAPRAATLKSHGDHRIGMAAAVAANAIEGESQIRGWSSVAVSYPDFAETLEHLSAT